MEAINQSFRSINQNVLLHAPCSVGILIDLGLGGTVGASSIHVSHVALLFLCGVDDREALYCVARMAEHPLTSLTILRLIPPVGEYDCEMESVTDEELLIHFRRKTAKNARVAYKEREASNVEEMVSAIRHMGNAYNLIVLGRGGKNKSPLVVGLEEWCECGELGPIGDLLSSEFGSTALVFVVQQYIGNGGQERVANGVL